MLCPYHVVDSTENRYSRHSTVDAHFSGKGRKDIYPSNMLIFRCGAIASPVSIIFLVPWDAVAYK
jgi:hypothetical protein